MKSLQLFLYFFLTLSIGPEFVHGVDMGTASPAPTESPAPSPSPSETPTDTQKPSVSLFPSTTPTLNPTTSEPSSHPSVEPTESPAPSPSPSETPTGRPSSTPSISQVPSESPSNYPSTAPSKVPTNYPTVAPTIEPSLAPSVSALPSVSASPTEGPIFVTASGNEFVFGNIGQKMDDETIKILEETILMYLSDQILEIQGAKKVSFETVRVTGQSVQETTNRRLSSAELRVLFDVAAFVLVENAAILDFENSISDFLKNDKHINELFEELIASSPFFDSLYIPMGARIDDGMNGSLARDQKRGMDVLLIIALTGGCLLMVGVTSLIFFQKRQQYSTSDSELSVSPYDDPENPYSFSTKRTASNESKRGDGEESIISDDDVPLKAFPSLHVQSADSDLFEHSMYTPAFISTESNIEIPVTPMTNFNPSQFTPGGNASATPRSTPSGTPDGMRTQILGVRKTGVQGFGSFFPTNRIFKGSSDFENSDSRMSDSQVSRHEATKTSESTSGFETRAPSNSLRIPEQQSSARDNGRESTGTPSLLSIEAVVTNKKRMSSVSQNVNSEEIESPSPYSPKQGSGNVPGRGQNGKRDESPIKTEKYVGIPSYESKRGIKTYVRRDMKKPLPRLPRIGTRTDSAGRIETLHRRRPSGYISEESD